MPTLTRFVLFLLICAAIIYGAAFALASFVRPTQVETRVDLPVEELLRKSEGAGANRQPVAGDMDDDRQGRPEQPDTDSGIDARIDE